MFDDGSKISGISGYVDVESHRYTVANIIYNGVSFLQKGLLHMDPEIILGVFFSVVCTLCSCALDIIGTERTLSSTEIMHVTMSFLFFLVESGACESSQVNTGMLCISVQSLMCSVNETEVIYVHSKLMLCWCTFA